MAQTSDELKQEIGQTREQMAETADALGLQGRRADADEGLGRRQEGRDRLGRRRVMPRSARRHPTVLTSPRASTG